MVDPKYVEILKAFKRVSRCEHEMIKALEDLSLAFDEQGIAPKVLIQGMIDDLDDEMYDLESEVEELIGEPA